MTTISRPETPAAGMTPHRTKRWPTLSVLLLVLGLGAGILAGRATAPEMPADLAPSELRDLLERQTDAINSGDASRIAEFYAEDATFTDIGNIYAKPISGRDEIAEVMAKNVALFGPFAGDVGTPIARGSFAAYVSTWGDVSAGVIVFELDDDGKILNQWVIHTRQ